MRSARCRTDAPKSSGAGNGATLVRTIGNHDARFENYLSAVPVSLRK
jgi:hypothetical protein